MATRIRDVGRGVVADAAFFLVFLLILVLVLLLGGAAQELGPQFPGPTYGQQIGVDTDSSTGTARA